MIASAGSGKTSTIVGKARYLLDYCDVLPSEMLLITFTKKASLELKERIGNEELECKTFHKYALDVVTRFNNERPSICDTNNNNAYDIVFEIEKALRVTGITTGRKAHTWGYSITIISITTTFPSKRKKVSFPFLYGSADHLLPVQFCGYGYLTVQS